VPASPTVFETNQYRDLSVTTGKLANSVLSADSTGRGKMQDGFFSADSVGRGKFSAGFVDNTLLGAGSVNYAKVDLTAGNSNVWSFGTNVAQCSTSPSTDYALANKAYVDAVASGMGPYKAAVRAATTMALMFNSTGNVYNNGTNGVGATITADSNRVLEMIDGVLLQVGERVLIKNEDHLGPNTPPKNLMNGIYTVTNLGQADPSGHPWILTRATDCDQNSEVKSAIYMFITEGLTLQDTGWLLSTTGTIDVGATDLGFVQFSRAGVISAGNGLQDSLGVFSVKNNDSSIGVSSSGVLVNCAAQGGLWVNSGLSIQLSMTSPALTLTSGLEVLLDSTTTTSSGLAKTSNGLRVKASDGSLGYAATDGGLYVKLDATTAASSGLQTIGTYGLSLKLSDTSLAFAGSNAGVKVNLASNPGLTISSGLLVQLDHTSVLSSGLQLTSNGLHVKLADTSLFLNSFDAGLSVNLADASLVVNSGLALQLDATTAASSGLQTTALRGVSLKLADTSLALAGSNAGVKVNLASTPGLTVNSGVAVLLDATTTASSGLALTSNGLRVKAGTSSALTYLGSDAGLAVALDTNTKPSSGLQITTSYGLSVKVADTSLALGASSDTGIAVNIASGAALGVNSGLYVKTDNSTTDVSGGNVIVKNAGITYAKLASGVTTRLGLDRVTKAVGNSTDVDFDLYAADVDGTETGLLVFKGGALQNLVDDYTFSQTGGTGGVSKVTFNTAPGSGTNLKFIYRRTGDTK
jgi:hypothetical protein